MTETLPDTVPAKLRGAMHELTHHYPVNFIADAAMHLLPEDKRADAAAHYFGVDTGLATKAIVKRFGGMNVAIAALNTLGTDAFVEVLRAEISKLDAAHAQRVFANLLKQTEAKRGDPWSFETEDGTRLMVASEPQEHIRIRERDGAREYDLLRFMTEYDVETGVPRKVAVYREVIKERFDGE